MHHSESKSHDYLARKMKEKKPSTRRFFDLLLRQFFFGVLVCHYIVVKKREEVSRQPAAGDFVSQIHVFANFCNNNAAAVTTISTDNIKHKNRHF